MKLQEYSNLKNQSFPDFLNPGRLFISSLHLLDARELITI